MRHNRYLDLGNGSNKFGNHWGKVRNNGRPLTVGDTQTAGVKRIVFSFIENLFTDETPTFPAFLCLSKFFVIKYSR